MLCLKSCTNILFGIFSFTTGVVFSFQSSIMHFEITVAEIAKYSVILYNKDKTETKTSTYKSRLVDCGS